MKISIRFFDDREVRAVWDDDHSKWWFSVVEVVGILNDEPDYTKAGNYWRWLKRKLLKANVQFVSGTHRLKLAAADGKVRCSPIIGQKTGLHKLNKQACFRSHRG